MWAIMREFNVLPTDERLTSLSMEQIDFILLSMDRDYDELERARRGVSLESEFEDYDSDWWDASHEEFTAIKEGDDEEDIARQLDSITTDEDLAKLKERYKANDALDQIEKDQITSINDLIATKLKAVFEEADRLNEAGVSNWGANQIGEEEERADVELGPLTSDGFDKAMNLFEGTYEDDYT